MMTAKTGPQMPFVDPLQRYAWRVQGGDAEIITPPPQTLGGTIPPRPPMDYTPG